MNSCPSWLTITVVVSLTSLQATAQQRPNIVVILADDLGYADVGFHGCQDIPTPHLDRLAASGVICTSGYSSHPYCSPMRAGMTTGKYQHRFGYERNIAYDPHNNRMGLPESELTIGTRLQQAGYRTGMLGKWHLGAARPFHPNHRGFDHFYGFLGGGHNYFLVDLTRAQGEGYFVPLQRNGSPVPLEGYLTTAITSEALRFIKRETDQPFFLFVSYNAPHTPMQAPDERLKRFASIGEEKRQSYAAMVSVLDDGVGQIVDALQQGGLRQETLVFFLSDNGGPEHANASDNGPLRGQKGDVYEGGIRVPFVASWPGVIPAGQQRDEPVVSIDVSATAVKVAGVETKPGELDGADLLPYLAGKTSSGPHEAIFWRMENGASWAVREGDLKLLQSKAGARLELYNLTKEIGEQSNASREHPADVARLRGRYETWNQSNQPPFFVDFRSYHRMMDQAYEELNQRAPAHRPEPRTQ